MNIYKNKFISILYLSIISCLLINMTGCNDKKSLNETNIIDGLSKTLYPIDLPIDLTVITQDSPHINKDNLILNDDEILVTPPQRNEQISLPILKSWEKKGIAVQVGLLPGPMNKYFQIGEPIPLYKVNTKNITIKKSDHTNSQGENDATLTIGKILPNKITNWIGPSDVMGIKRATVSYTVKNEYEEWVPNEVKDIINKQISNEIIQQYFILTNNGWLPIK